MSKKKNPPKRYLDSIPDGLIGNLLADEPDRGCVLVGTSFLEFRVYELFEAQFVRNPERDIEVWKDIMFAKQALLGTAWAKATIALVFGLMDREHYDILDEMRKLRNTFAHRPGRVDLNDASVAPLIAKVITGKAMLDKFLKAHESKRGLWDELTPTRSFSPARIAFMTICLIVNSYLIRRTSEIDPREEKIRQDMLNEINRVAALRES